jgi:predicted glutamine amidotransferase
MCLIVIGNKENVVKQTTILQNALTQNKDGFGLMYFKNDNIVSKKTLSDKFHDVDNLIKSASDDCHGKIALHFRFATEGIKDKRNTHPIPILTKAIDGRAISLMHNSPMLPTAIIDKDRSDTHQFVKYYLRPVLKSNVDLLYNQKWLDQLNRDCEGSRLVFADGKTNNFIYVNKKLWTKKDKIWYSNGGCFNTVHWSSRYATLGKSYSSYDYNGTYDVDEEEDYKPTKHVDKNQAEMFDKATDDFLDLPFEDELLLELDESQLKEYQAKNPKEIVEYLMQLKYSMYQ